MEDVPEPQIREAVEQIAAAIGQVEPGGEAPDLSAAVEGFTPFVRFSQGRVDSTQPVLVKALNAAGPQATFVMAGWGVIRHAALQRTLVDLERFCNITTDEMCRAWLNYTDLRATPNEDFSNSILGPTAHESIETALTTLRELYASAATELESPDAAMGVTLRALEDLADEDPKAVAFIATLLTRRNAELEAATGA